MKSINEKAEEYAFIKQGIDPAGIQYRDFNIDKQDGFKAGANYVLDAIQSCIDRHEDGCLALEAIILTIDELKKK